MSVVFRVSLWLILLLNFVSLEIKAQLPNPCGVIARIYPYAADSVVPVGTRIDFKNLSINADSIIWLINGIPHPNAQDWSIFVSTGTQKIGLVAFKGNCTDTVMSVYFSAGSPHNTDSMLTANFGTYRYNEEATCLDKTADSGFIMGGVQYLWDQCGEAGIIVKTRDKGCIDWSKKILSPFYCNNSKITSIVAGSDGTYFAVIHELELIKLDSQGNILWNKTYRVDEQSSPYPISFMVTDPDGFLYIANNANREGFLLTKLDKDGNFIWNKVYKFSFNSDRNNLDGDFISPMGLVWLNNKIYVAGTANSKIKNTFYGFLAKLDAGTGSREWQYAYTLPNHPDLNIFTHLSTYDTLLMASTAAHSHIITLIDPQGQVKKNIKSVYGLDENVNAMNAGADNKGHIYMMQWVQGTLPLQPYYFYNTSFAEIDTSLNRYGTFSVDTYSKGFLRDAKMGKDNQFAAVGLSFGNVDDALYSSANFRFIKFDTVPGSQNCFQASDFPVSIEPIERLSFQYTADSSFNLMMTPGSGFTTTEGDIQMRYNCPDFLDSCSLLKLSGPVTLCSTSDTYKYRIHKNRKCNLIPKWNFSPGVTIVSQTDSTIFLKFAALGTYKIEAIIEGCSIVRDSLIITVLSKSGRLDLGADTIICANSVIPIHAGENFLTYQWNDGSTDSVLLAKGPGLYWVEVIDSCSNHIRDSIIISPYTVDLNLGDDRMICTADTVRLVAPEGFISYTWKNNYQISSLNSREVIVQPLVDTTYYLQAEKLAGCFAYDSVRITVKSSPPIELGINQSICDGDSLIIDGGAGFDHYTWSNGDETQQIVVNSYGMYTVIGTSSDGCTSTDSMAVTDVWPLPEINFDQNPNICEGTTRILEPGNFTNYLWQNGSTASSYEISTIGTYYVTVTDSHGCVGADTVRIKQVIPPPGNFLPADTSICNYGELTILSDISFKDYQWNTGQTSSAIKIKQAGLYWLSVTDQDNCIGTDSILVSQKECMMGFYVPNAFSPNADGKNDTFKPMLFGDLVFYNFTIFNRFGEVVFTSKDPTKGWDGTVKGIQQNQGNFVWKCSYQLGTEKPITTSGSFILIR